jgi:3,4-dihydroxy 2-butanone 4-phosphate synthase/GTP cyclohydrolase II
VVIVTFNNFHNSNELHEINNSLSYKISSTEEIVGELSSGRMVVLIDDEDRENEGDLMIASDFVTPEAINFMASHGRGLICLTLTGDLCDRLGLELMAKSNNSPFQTNFTVSIEAASGVTTGISAADRARTIKVAVSPDVRPDDLVQPGHIFPLRALDGGVLVRSGHTEAGCDFARLAKLSPSAVICEILKDDGTMARLPDLLRFAQTHSLKLGTIADLIHYRSQHEATIKRLDLRKVTTWHGEFDMVVYSDQNSSQFHLALVKGVVSGENDTLVRVHEPFTNVDLLDIDDQRHSWNLNTALSCISNQGNGVVVLLNCTSTPQDLFASFVSGTSSEIKKNSSEELRDFGIGAQILRDIGVRRMRLLSPERKMPSMTGFGLEVVEFVDSPGQLIARMSGINAVKKWLCRSKEESDSYKNSDFFIFHPPF